MSMHPAHKNPKYDAVYRFLCGLADRDLPCPQMRALAARVSLTQFSVGNAFYALRKAGLIRTASQYTAFGLRYLVVEIVSSGRKTAAPEHKNSDLPSDGQSNESAGGPGVVSAIDPVILDRLPPCAPAAEPVVSAPPPLSSQMRGSLGSVVGRKLAPHSSNGRYQNYNVSTISAPDIDRIRQINASLPKAVAIPASWNCQWPLWDDKPDGRYCGKKRSGPMPYCQKHTQRAYRRAGEAAA